MVQDRATGLLFSPLGSLSILVFLYQTAWNIPSGTPLTGASNADGVGKNAFLDLRQLHCVYTMNAKRETQRCVEP